MKIVYFIGLLVFITLICLFGSAIFFFDGEYRGAVLLSYAAISNYVMATYLALTVKGMYTV